jgi:hypothetical protein
MEPSRRTANRGQEATSPDEEKLRTLAQIYNSHALWFSNNPDYPSSWANGELRRLHRAYRSQYRIVHPDEFGRGWRLSACSRFLGSAWRRLCSFADRILAGCFIVGWLAGAYFLLVYVAWWAVAALVVGTWLFSLLLGAWADTHRRSPRG